MSWLWLPHSVQLGQRTNSTRGGTAIDGDTGAVDASTLSVHVSDPLTAVQIEEKYGIPNVTQGYLIIGEADDFENIAKGDLMTYDGKQLQVAEKPRIWKPGDGYNHGELIAEDLSRSTSRL